MYALLALAALVHVCAGAITGISVDLHSTSAGTVTLADVALTTSMAIPIGGKLQVAFPTGFVLAPTALSDGVGIDGASAVSKAGTTLIVTVATSVVAAGVVTFTVDGITNPGASTLAAFTITSLNAVSVVLESGSGGGGAVIAVGAPLVATVTLANTTASVTSLCTLSITTFLTLPIGASFRVVFPSRFAVAPTQLTFQTGFAATTTALTSTSSSATVTIGAFALAPGTYGFTLNGITNPGSSCNMYYMEACLVTWEPYTVSTLDAAQNVYETASVPGTSIIKSHLYFGRVRTLATTPSTATSATILFNTLLRIPSGGMVLVTFPDGYAIPNPGWTLSGWIGLSAASAASITGLTLTITSATTIAPMRGIQFTLSGVTTPPLNTVGTYQIATQDSNGNVIEDADNIGGVGCYFLKECSGHGDCTLMSSKCICNAGWGAPTDISIGAAPDCSRRTCPSGLAWNDVPTAPTVAHTTLVECSNQGACNRTSGACNCFPGYTGSACDRMSCPNDCSGHGTCLSLQEMAMLTTAVPVASATTYSLWDATRIYGCVCDSSWPVGLGAGQTRVAEWFGADCSMRHCPSGDDPMTAEDETNCGGVAAPGGAVGAVGNLCYNECSGRGVCYYQSGQCRCFDGFEGLACNAQNVLVDDSNRSELAIALAGY
ncbi:hypothetical protein SDRG_04104 [Saprolegnia diclina VS20]|uniref:EGF-like domain-containing protein n=1 Tax=Saprolegnia diclina (strain VS20) TaxID=1156394 RepID=T0PU39_SAPDV|nr:hypothetical protein SDRG_04104 [Saprolegnia diclina VS20]XP_008617653.1 hypothetical protein SDRG_13349 [Saprolegnia diclina VS20]EQC29014.1 hypothetical protein SDRG_13349 [Saprolegnia diclina VS20]EQC38393.1 hypothetical protein SDRG_04104 [Saprolegnia diclina VS20]|eukprot:XP_008607985.1 hypothetical protein SDRG_04104 [Saprolegnia diclina VS20]